MPKETDRLKTEVTGVKPFEVGAKPKSRGPTKVSSVPRLDCCA